MRERVAGQTIFDEEIDSRSGWNCHAIDGESPVRKINLSDSLFLSTMGYGETLWESGASTLQD